MRAAISFVLETIKPSYGLSAAYPKRVHDTYT